MWISNSHFCWFFNLTRNEINVIWRQWEHALSFGIWWQCIWKSNSGSLQMQDAARLWILLLSCFSENCIKSLASDAEVRVFLRVQVSGWSGTWCRNLIFWFYFDSSGNENKCSLEEVTVYNSIWNTNCNTYGGLTLAARRCNMRFSLQIMFHLHFEPCEKCLGNVRVWYHILYRTIWTRHWILWLSCRSGVTSPPGWFWERPPNSNLQNSISKLPPNSTYRAHKMGRWANERWSSSFDSRKYELKWLSKRPAKLFLWFSGVSEMH